MNRTAILEQKRSLERMFFLSTRGRAPEANFAGALESGLAPDGGLYRPATIPKLWSADIEAMRGMNYVEIAQRIMPFFGADPSYLEEILNSAYAPEAWEGGKVAPLKRLANGIYVLELFGGPTCSFKDVGMRFLGPNHQRILKKAGRSSTILAATSGDTGPAGIDAYRGSPDVNVVVLFPKDGTSEIQRRQMTTVQADNIFPVAIEGSFDDCQGVVKKLNTDEAFRRHFNLGAFNSFNFGRVLPQVVYYISAYFEATEKQGQPVMFVVPTGNFGNIYAGTIACRMGWPMKFVLATNENDILVDLVERGRYASRGEPTKTEAPSIDIAASSNVWGLFWEVLGRNSKLLRDLQDQFEKFGVVALSPESEAFKSLHEMVIAARSSTKAQRADMIRRIYKDYNYLIDPHTAAGFAAAFDEFRTSGEKVVFLATASPAKFAPAMKEALGIDIEIPERLQKLMGRPETCVTLHPSVSEVKEYMLETIPKAR